jgi:hypothetical protein
LIFPEILFISLRTDVIVTVKPTSVYIPFTPAKYGKPVSSLGHVMNLAYAGDGCQSISVPKGSVALVDVSTTCTAYNQTLNAQKAEASAVILINKYNSTFSATAPSSVNPSEASQLIPTVMVRQDDGMTLRASKNGYIGQQGLLAFKAFSKCLLVF